MVPFPWGRGVQRQPLSQCRTARREEEPKVAPHSSVSEERLHSREGKACGSPLPSARSPSARARRHWALLLLTSKLSATASLLPTLQGALTSVLSFRMGTRPLAPSTHATLCFSSFCLGTWPPTPPPPLLHRDVTRWATSQQLQGGQRRGRRGPGSSAPRALSKDSGHGSRRNSAARKRRTFQGSACGTVPRPLPAPLHSPADHVVPETCLRRSSRRFRGAGGGGDAWEKLHGLDWQRLWRRSRRSPHLSPASDGQPISSQLYARAWPSSAAPPPSPAAAWVCSRRRRREPKGPPGARGGRGSAALAVESSLLSDRGSLPARWGQWPTGQRRGGGG